MSHTGKVAAAIALVFASGVATAFAKGTPEPATLAASAPVVAPGPATTATTPIPAIEAPTPVAADALPSTVDAPTTAAVAPKPAPAAAKPVGVAPKPVAAPVPASALPAVTPTAPIAPVVVPAAPATTTTSAPTPVRPVCTDTSLDHRSSDLAGRNLDQTRSFPANWNTTHTTMIGAYAECVAGGGTIDPRHDDVNGNGDGDYCGGDLPPATSSSQFSEAITAQSDCLAELASRNDFPL